MLSSKLAVASSARMSLPVKQRPKSVLPTSPTVLIRVRDDYPPETEKNPLLAIDSEKMQLMQSAVWATRSASNDAWFTKLAIDREIAKAVQQGYNMCFFVGGMRGTGRDYCLFGGNITNAGTSKNVQPLKQREPGLVRLSFETIIALICANKNA